MRILNYFYEKKIAIKNSQKKQEKGGQQRRIFNSIKITFV